MGACLAATSALTLRRDLFPDRVCTSANFISPPSSCYAWAWFAARKTGMLVAASRAHAKLLVGRSISTAEVQTRSSKTLYKRPLPLANITEAARKHAQRLRRARQTVEERAAAVATRLTRRAKQNQEQPSG